MKGEGEWKTLLELGYREHPKDHFVPHAGAVRRKIGAGAIYYVAFDIGKLFATADIRHWRTFFRKLVDLGGGQGPADSARGARERLPVALAAGEGGRYIFI